MKQKVIYYTGTENEDFKTIFEETKPLPEKYKYYKKNIFAKGISWFLYHILARPIGYIFLKIHYHHKIVGKKNIKKIGGCFIYANHTLEVSDVFIPSMLRIRKNYMIAGPQAKTLRFILPLMRSVGSLPLPDNLKQTKEFFNVMHILTKKKNSITIYPEAHVWPYYTGIRNFPQASFKYAIKENVPVVAMTNCFTKQKIGKRVKITTYIDGPFYPDPSLNSKQNEKYLHDLVYNAMKERTEKYSTYSFNTYIKKEEN